MSPKKARRNGLKIATTMLAVVSTPHTQSAQPDNNDRSSHNSVSMSAVSPSIQADAINVRAYLSVCSSSADVNVCATKAADRAKAAGVPLYFPTGTYPLSAWSPPCPLQIIGDGEGKTVLQRSVSTSAGNVINSSNCGELAINGLTIDGNKTSNSAIGYTVVINGDWRFSIANVEIKNTKGAGSALTLRSTRDDSNNTSSSLSNLYVHDNEGNGIYIQYRAWNWALRDSVIRNNGGVGVSVIDYVFPPTEAQFSSCSIVKNDVSYNAGSGISLTSDITGGAPLRPTNGFFGTVQNCKIVGNRANYNRSYGIIMAGGLHIEIGSNTTTHNGMGAGSAVAGINAALCKECDIHDNTAEFNDYYGIDSGGAIDSRIHDNVIKNNGNAAANNGNGINCGACRGVEISKNMIGSNGWANGGAQIHITTYDAGIAGLPLPAQNVAVRANHLTCANANEVGLQVLSDPPGTIVEDNWTEGCAPLKGYVLHVTGAQIHRNRQDNWINGRTFAATSADVVYPDAVDSITLPVARGSVVTALKPYFYSTSYQTVYAVVVNSGGVGYSVSPAVTFTGGGCSREPTGRAFQDNAGHVVGVNLITYGAGCTFAPGAVFTDTSGSGASATCYVLNSLPINGRELKVQAVAGVTLKNDPLNLNLLGNANFVVPSGSGFLSTFEGRESRWIETARTALVP